MTLEQIVNTHPCPIIRGKIMEKVGKGKDHKSFRGLLYFGFYWRNTKEGYGFWTEVCKNLTAPYSDLKHLDNSYVPETALPPVMWRKIDKDNLCIDTVSVIHKDDLTQIFTGTLELDRYDEITLYMGNRQYLHGFTHYIPLSNLINLPIED